MAKKGFLAVLIGVGAGAAVFGAYCGALYAGVRIRPDLILAAAAALAFAGTVAVFALVAMYRPDAWGIRARLLLSEEPATEYVFPFHSGDLHRISVKPEMSFGEIFARSADTFRKAPSDVSKAFIVTIKGSAKMSLATITLQQVFLTLKPFRLQHVLLLNEKGRFVGYIPGKVAAKEFTANDAAEKIGKYIVKVIDKPEDGVVLREIGGVPNLDADMIGQTEDTRLAEAKIWANEAIRGLVVHRGLEPVGYISKEDVLRLNAGRD